MNTVRGAVRRGLRDRPFDFYVAFLIFLAGTYSFVSDTWPEKYHSQTTSILIYIVSIYMVVASLLVMFSLLCDRSTRPVFSLLAEMWGWLAISAASTATFLMYAWILISQGYSDFGLSFVLDLIWLGMALASFFRSLDIYLFIKGRR
jgi:hypothetical protein